MCRSLFWLQRLADEHSFIERQAKRSINRETRLKTVSGIRGPPASCVRAMELVGANSLFR